MPAASERMRAAYITRGVMSTAAIEGNTLTEDQVERRLAGQLKLPPSQEYLGREIDNLQRAYDRIAAGLDDNERRDLTEAEIIEFNQIILEGLELSPEVKPGQYASKPHGVGTYRAPSPEAIRELMPRFFEWINGDEWFTDLGSPLATQILRAILAHLYLAWIHPFGDGNGRTARMVEADILARSGVPAISYHLLSTHYNQTRTEYYRVLAQTSATPGGDPLAFVAYALQGLVDGLRQQIAEIKQQHREVMWRDFVHDQFRGEDTEKFQRLRRLAIDLAEQEGPVSKTDLWLLTRRVAQAYQGKTEKTLTRDIRELTTRGLIIRKGSGYVANLDQLNFFVAPARKQPVRKPAKRKATAA